jgi:hypothetical protein
VSERRNLPAVVEVSAPAKATALRSMLVVPAMIADAGECVRSEGKGQGVSQHGMGVPFSGLASDAGAEQTRRRRRGSDQSALVAGGGGVAIYCEAGDGVAGASWTASPLCNVSGGLSTDAPTAHPETR